MEKLINKLLLDLKENGWTTGVEINKKEILQNGGKEFITNLLSNPEFRYTYAPRVFLIIPQIWNNFSLDDWKYVLRNVKRPLKYRPLFDESASFEDIKFLYNWIKIDSLKLFDEDPEISDEIKQKVRRLFPNFLSMDLDEDLAEEDFKDGTFGDRKYLAEMRDRLISQGAVGV